MELHLGVNLSGNVFILTKSFNYQYLLSKVSGGGDLVTAKYWTHV